MAPQTSRLTPNSLSRSAFWNGSTPTNDSSCSRATCPFSTSMILTWVATSNTGAMRLFQCENATLKFIVSFMPYQGCNYYAYMRKWEVNRRKTLSYNGLKR